MKKVSKKEKTSIWIVDDDPSISEAVKIVLEDAGYKTTNFENSKEMYSKLKKAIPDVIIIDVLLTGENGLSIVENLRSNEVYVKLPIILMSANNLTDTDVKDSGANSFIRKPFDIYDLVDAVQQCI